jgi:hypothetical protein
MMSTTISIPEKIRKKREETSLITVGEASGEKVLEAPRKNSKIAAASSDVTAS